MRAARIKIKNFRGIKQATLILPNHGVFIGDNNTGKTTILEALDLALGPDRLNRRPPVDEHDFFRGLYTFSTDVDMNEGEVADDDNPNPLTDEAESTEEAPRIEIEVTVADLTEEQKGTFADYIEFWDSVTNKLYDAPDPAGVDAANITEALRVTFHGWYDEEEDDFEGKTYFTRSLTESGRPDLFSKKHKQVCGFLYLRSHRTGTRALSLERGSLLDIMGIRISWLIFSLACNHRLHFPNGKTGWRGLEQMRKDCGTREFIAHPSVYLERSLSANLSDVPLTADNTRMEFST